MSRRSPPDAPHDAGSAVTRLIGLLSVLSRLRQTAHYSGTRPNADAIDIIFAQTVLARSIPWRAAQVLLVNLRMM